MQPRSPLMFAFLAFVLIASSSTAADMCGCNAGLAPYFEARKTITRVDYAFLSQLDRQQYDKIKDRKDLQIKYESFNFGQDYSKFEERRNSEFSRIGFSLSQSQSESLVIDTVHTTDWLQCKRDCIEKASGFVCDIVNYTVKFVSVGCSWRPQFHDKAREVTITANGKRLPDKLKVEPYISATTDQQIDRNKTEDLLVTLTLDGGPSQTLKLDAVPPAVPDGAKGVQPMAIGSCLGRGSLAKVRFWGPAGQRCNGVKDWERYAVVPQDNVRRLCSCKAGMLPGIPVQSGGNVVNDHTFWGPEGQPCMGRDGWGTYNDQCIDVDNKLELCTCPGSGSFDGHHVWGPKGKTCQIPPWGTYRDTCLGPSSTSVEK